MKKLFVLLSALMISFIAFVDAKDRFAELESLSVETPAQVEMKQMMDRPETLMKPDDVKNNIPENSQNLHDKLRKDAQDSLKRQLEFPEKKD